MCIKYLSRDGACRNCQVLVSLIIHGSSSSLFISFLSILNIISKFQLFKFKFIFIPIFCFLFCLILYVMEVSPLIFEFICNYLSFTGLVFVYEKDCTKPPLLPSAVPTSVYKLNPDVSKRKINDCRYIWTPCTIWRIYQSFLNKMAHWWLCFRQA